MKNKLIFLSVFLLIICLTIIIASFTKNSYAAYVPKTNPLGSSVKNIDLLYFGSNVDYDNSYKNMIYYIDSNGNYSKNIFMDSFILLPASSYLGSSSGNKIWNMTTSDITGFLQSEFNQLVALNNVVKSINNVNNTDVKINVFLSIIIPSNSKTSSAVNSFINSSINMFESGTYDVSNLNLVGFYWYHEDVTSTTDESLVTSFNTYVHNKGYKTIWVPYVSNYNAVSAGESHINDWHRFGYSKYNFDFVSIQSGYYFHGDDQVWLNFRNGTKRLPFVNNEASSYGMGVELEVESSLYVSSNNCNLFKDFLSYAVKSDTGWNQGINVYYFPRFLSDIEDSRILYDLIYKYAKGNLTSAQVNSFSCTKSYYSKFENVSKGKSYTLVPFVNSSGSSASSSYLDNGVKLTDGKYGDSAYGDEWVGFTRNISSNLKYIDIDLSKIETSLSYFSLELEKDESAGIKLPSNPIKVYISDTNSSNSYKYVGSLSKAKTTNVYKSLFNYELNLGNNTISGRYVRFAWETNNEPFVFISEVVVGKTSTIEFNKEPLILNGDENGTVFVSITDGTYNNLSIKVDNTDVITATIDPYGVIDIHSVGGGTSDIIVTDNRYGNYATYNVTVIDNDYYNFDNSLNVDENNKIIDNVKYNTYVGDIINSISTNGKITVFDNENNEISDDGSRVGTGYKIKIELSNNSYEYLISVKGDLSGDGYLNVLDEVELVDVILNNKELDKIYYSAADYNGDDNINVIDIVEIENEIVNGE